MTLVFQLAFDVWSTGRGCAASDIVPSPGSKVWGVVYDVGGWAIGWAASNRRGGVDFAFLLFPYAGTPQPVSCADLPPYSPGFSPRTSGFWTPVGGPEVPAF